MPLSPTVNRSEQTQAFFSHGKCRFSLKSRFSKGYPKKNKNEKLTKIDLENCFWGESKQNFLSSVPNCFFSHAPSRERQKPAASITPHLLNTCDCSCRLMLPDIPQAAAFTGSNHWVQGSNSAPQRAKEGGSWGHICHNNTTILKSAFYSKISYVCVYSGSLTMRGYSLLAVIRK